MIKVGRADLKIGAPIAWNAYNEAGKLLIKRGYVLQSHHQIEVLLKQGLYMREDFSVERIRPNPEKSIPPSVMTIISRELKHLDGFLKIVRGKVDFPDIQDRFLSMAQNVATVVRTHRDICLGFVFFNKSTDNYPVRHSLDTAIISIIMAESIGKAMDEILNIAAASLTMNVSMLQLQERLLSKEGQLSDKELSKINRHPIVSRNLLEQAGIHNRNWLEYVLYHHEKDDGSGYPEGLKGDTIPEGAKIICLADRYMARVSPRCYREGLLPNVVLKKLLIYHGNTMDLAHAAVLTKVIGIYPPGTFVKLRNGDTAVVVASGVDGASPIVKSILDSDNKPLPFPITHNTQEQSLRIVGAVHLNPSQIPFGMMRIWGKESEAN